MLSAVTKGVSRLHFECGAVLNFIPPQLCRILWTQFHLHLKNPSGFKDFNHTIWHWHLKHFNYSLFSELYCENETHPGFFSLLRCVLLLCLFHGSGLGTFLSLAEHGAMQTAAAIPHAVRPFTPSQPWYYLYSAWWMKVFFISLIPNRALHLFGIKSAKSLP